MNISNAKDVKHEIRNELKSLSFEELINLKQKIGMKVYNESIFSKESKRPSITSVKRENKNRPREISSKIPVIPQLLEKPSNYVKKSIERRDPRFDSLCGSFDTKTFNEDYKFIDEIRTKEMAQLKTAYKEEDDQEERQKIKTILQRWENQQREKANLEKKKAKLKEQREKYVNDMKEGKRPHFRTKGERKVLDLVDKYEELKSKGRLQKFLKKKYKKDTNKFKFPTQK